MNNAKITLALIYGGQGYESSVSIRGAEHLLPILSELFNCLPVFIDADGRWIIQKREVFTLKSEGMGGLFCPKTRDFYPVDCAFPLLHGDFGEDGIIQSALDLASIPYIGCDGRVGAICRDKAIVKNIAKALGIPTLPFILADRDAKKTVEIAEKSFEYPMIVKPTSLGSSQGVSIANDKCELADGLEYAFSMCNRVMIEPLLQSKRELECAYFGVKGQQLFTKAGEILSGDHLYDYDKKYKTGGLTLTEAEVEPIINNTIHDYSKKLIDFIGVRDLSRIDYFLSGDELYFNEINTMPGFTNGSLYERMLNSCGISTDRMLRSLVFEAIGRS